MAETIIRISKELNEQQNEELKALLNSPILHEKAKREFTEALAELINEPVENIEVEFKENE